MTYIAKPKVHHPSLKANAIGLTRRDYEGAITTLCAGCGHDSITAAIIQAFWELSIPPHKVAKLSGIGCSSKTPAYFLREAHGFNSVHGRMPAVATGANAGNGWPFSSKHRAISPMTKISGWFGGFNSGVTVICPERLICAPVCSAIERASGEASTPAAQRTVRASICSVSVPWRTVTQPGCTFVTSDSVEKPGVWN